MRLHIGMCAIRCKQYDLQIELLSRRLSVKLIPLQTSLSQTHYLSLNLLHSRPINQCIKSYSTNSFFSMAVSMAFRLFLSFMVSFAVLAFTISVKGFSKQGHHGNSFKIFWVNSTKGCRILVRISKAALRNCLASSMSSRFL